MAAASSILLGRSSACLSHFYRGYLSTAAKRSHHILLGARRSSSNSSVGDNMQLQLQQQQPDDIQLTVFEILEQIKSVRKDIDILSKERQGKKEAPIKEVVKEKHPLLKNIQLEVDDFNRQRDQKLQLPHGFEVVSDNKPGAATVTLKGGHENEIINIVLSIPTCYVMVLSVKVTLCGLFSGVFNSTERVFLCNFTQKGLEVEKIMEPNGTGHEILFYYLSENLKDEFHIYLKIRGIHEDNLSILYKYMVRRKNRENLRGLESFKKMVDSA